MFSNYLHNANILPFFPYAVNETFVFLGSKQLGKLGPSPYGTGMTERILSITMSLVTFSASAS